LHHWSNTVNQLSTKMNGSSLIERLLVTHRLKSPDDGMPRSEMSDKSAPMRALRLDTCLREVTIELLPAADSSTQAISDPESLNGIDAYRLLLEITTGLRSKIPGETNVFGQFRRAWQTFLNQGHPTTTAGLTPLIHRLCNDTKTVRNNWLKDIGGSSYGSLVRRLIKPCRQDRVLFVGNGELMASMLPLFEKFQLGVWNHHAIKQAPVTVDAVFQPEQGSRAASWADHVILTTPCDQLNDQRWRVWLSHTQPSTIVHLGHRHSTRFDWEADITAFNLDDVFLLHQQQKAIRSDKLDKAHRACANLTNLLGSEADIYRRQSRLYSAGLVTA
jgi:hypothetical protein